MKKKCFKKKKSSLFPILFLFFFFKKMVICKHKHERKRALAPRKPIIRSPSLFKNRIHTKAKK